MTSKSPLSRRTYGLGLFIFIFAFYVGLEMSLVNFLPSILIEQTNVSSAVASLGVSLFWVAIVIGRIYAGVIAEKVRYFQYLLWSNIGTLLVLLLFAVTTKIWGTLSVILILGLFMSGTFAVALTLANVTLQGKTETTTSLLIASGGLGGALFPPFIGWAMDTLSTKGSLLILAGFQALLILLLLATSRLPE